jgi:tRNA(fMet)-specific endonuclease VapC
MYLIDTNICIYTIKKNPISVVNNLESLQPFHVKISAVTVAELEYGIAKSNKVENNRKTLIKFLSPFDIIPFNDLDAEIFGYLRAELERNGKVIGPYDLQIAAQALARDLILVSNNTKEFNRVPNLKLENWV